MNMDSTDEISYEYKANVKDKIKKLETSSKNISLAQQSSIPNSIPVKTKKNLRSEIAKTSPGELQMVESNPSGSSLDSSAAVMDVETMQIDSHNNTSMKSPIDTGRNNLNEGDHNPAPAPVSVKNLLRRFSSGMTHTFKKKQMPQTENSRISDQTSSALDRTLVVTSDTRNDKVQIIELDAVMSEMPHNSPSQKLKTRDSKNKSKETSKLSLDQPQCMISPERRGSYSFGNIVSISKNFRNDGVSLERAQNFSRSAANVNIPSSFQNNTEDTKMISGSDLDADVAPKLAPSPKKVPEHNFSKPNESVYDFQSTFNNSPEIILVIGPGRAGKSALVNYLLRQDLSPVYKTKPQQRDIVECKIDFCTSVLVLDTPSFENDEYDAPMLSTLLSHLKSLEQHPELILAVLQVEMETNKTQERLYKFSKMLFHYHQTSFSGMPNILFVLTHSMPLQFMQIEKALENLNQIIQQCFSTVIAPQICFHKIDTGLLFEEHAPLIATYANLLTGIKSMYNPQNNNKRSNAISKIFNDSYPVSVGNCFVSKRIPLRSLEHPESIKVTKVLQNIYQNVVIETTEISTLLEIGWENVDPILRAKYPSSLITLQKVFQKCALKQFSILPEDPLKIFELLRHIPQHNPAITDLLTETLQLKIPSCYSALYIGQGFDISKDTVTHVTPFQFSNTLKTSPVGLIPEEISCKTLQDREIVFKFYSSAEDYVIDRLHDLGINDAAYPKSDKVISSSSVFSNQRIGYNLVRPGQEPSKTTTASSAVEYRIFQLSLRNSEEIKFKATFWETVTSLPELDVKRSDTIGPWEEFFKHWGTHIVTDAYGGGSVEVTFRGAVLSKIFKSVNQKSVLPTDEYETSNVFQWVTGDGLDFARAQNPTSMIQGMDVEAKFNGGDMRFSQFDLTKLPYGMANSLRQEWLQSLLVQPIILETNLTLVPISYFLREKSEAIATRMDLAFVHFYSNFMGSQGRNSSCFIL